jgi:hypothetical protein
MKKRTLVILLASVAILSCKPTEQREEQAIAVEQPCREVVEKPYSNPALIFGTSFGCFFQTLYRNNQFDLMLAFTADKTVKQFGRDKVLNYYKHNFKFDYRLGQLSNIFNEGDRINLTYSKAFIYATRRKVVIPCCLEHDSIKIFILSLSRNPFE